MIHVRDCFQSFLQLLVLAVLLAIDFVMVGLESRQLPFKDSYFVLKTIYQLLALCFVSLAHEQLLILCFDLVEDWYVLFYCGP